MALLAVRGPRPRSYLAGTLWPDGTEDRALTSLRAAVWHLRQNAPGLVHANRVQVSLSPQVRSDVGDVLAMAQALATTPEEVDPATALATLSTDDLLPGWYDDWVLLERERLRHVRIRALDTLARHRLVARDPETAAAAAHLSALVEPLRETPQRLLVAAELAMGNVAEAHCHVTAYRQRLLDELGIEPSPRLSELIRPRAS